MKFPCFVLVVALAIPGCSTFSKDARRERAYRKYVSQGIAAKEKRRKQWIEHQRAQMSSSLRNPPPPVEQENVQVSPQSENP
jgi:hypothetical protein